MNAEDRGPRGFPPLSPPWLEPRRPGAPGGGRPGGLPGAPAGQGAAPPASSSLIVFPPDYFPADGSTDFLLQGNAAGLIIASGVTVLDTFQIPAQDRGVIRSVVIGVNDFTAVGAVRFRVLIAGNAPPAWGDLRIPPQAAAFTSFSYGPEETRILVDSGAQIQVTVEVLAGGPFGASAVLHGWHWGK